MSHFHRAIQNAILQRLPGAISEYRFSHFGRIADIVYFPKKIIIEVQCSPISLKEVQKRNRDYLAHGFTVIWILHDRIYNKKIVTQAELYLRQNLSYYTSVTPFGYGFFYDQLDFFHGTKRVYQSKPYLLKGLLPTPLTKTPLFFPKKLKKRSLFIPGDATDSLIIQKQGKWARKLEKAYTQKWTIKKVCHEIFLSLLRKHASALHTDSEKQNKGSPLAIEQSRPLPL